MSEENKNQVIENFKISANIEALKYAKDLTLTLDEAVFKYTETMNGIVKNTHLESEDYKVFCEVAHTVTAMTANEIKANRL